MEILSPRKSKDLFHLSSSFKMFSTLEWPEYINIVKIFAVPFDVNK